MRKAEEIKAALAAAQDHPEPEREARRDMLFDMLFMEVLLDIRDKLDVIESYAIHTEGHAEKLKNRLCE